MKKKSFFICVLLWAFLLTCLTGCGEKQEQILSGSYTSQGLLNQMNYTFDTEKNVTVRFLVGGYSAFSQTGTYEINEDGSIITFSFPTGEEGADAYLPSGMTSLGGAFSFKQEEDCVWIGTVCYQKDTPGTESEETAQPDAEGASTGTSPTEALSLGEEPVPLDQIHLTLPETYVLSYEVTEESSGISRTYTQTMTCTDTGIFLDLGDSDEKYVFEKLESGKYKEFRGHLDYQGQETVESVECQKYAAAFTAASGEQAVELWIDPQTGLCIRGIYQYQPAIGVTGTKTIRCTKMETEQVTLPAYR